MKCEIQITGVDTDRPEIKLTLCKGRFEIVATDGTEGFLTNPTMMDNGRTVGSNNTEWLHGALDCWLTTYLADGLDKV